MAKQTIEFELGDIQQLLDSSPLFQSQLEAIVLRRLLSEREQELAMLKGESENVTNIKEVAGD